MNDLQKVYLLVLSGKVESAEKIAELHFPGCDRVILNKRDLREMGWKGVAQELLKLKGEALFIFTEDFSYIDQPQLMACLGFCHRCHRTVLADGNGHIRAFTRLQLILQLPKLALSAFLDAFVVAVSWVALRCLVRPVARPATVATESDSCLDIAVLYPYPLQQTVPGGEMSYLKGVLSGFAEESARCEIFSGCPLPFDYFQTHIIPNRRRFYLLRESLALSYNLRFFREAMRRLRHRRPRLLYQRHGRFVIAGALLSRFLRIPLVLEYQCSEQWRGKNWDPVHFQDLLRRCENVSIATSSKIVALSTALRDELVEIGIQSNNVVINPAAVDPSCFQPGSCGNTVRAQLAFTPQQIVIGFVGSFSYYHGITVLEEAIRILLDRDHRPLPQELRFLLVGDGLLRPEMRERLRGVSPADAVVFTGSVAHDRIPGFLDAADILVSPHLPFADGKRFFGSPSKLFEYMAMGKAIVASDLEQLAQMLDHQVTALLVTPGNAEELAAAIELLAADGELRQRLGRQAREVALSRHTWRRNAARLLSQFPLPPGRAPKLQTFLAS